MEKTSNCICKTCKREYIYSRQLKKMGYTKTVCNSCTVANFRRQRKLDSIAYLGGKCEICGYNKYSGALDFHHKDPSQKSFSLSMGGLNRSWELTKAELDKCQLLCANCHREIHAIL
jgi:hypothetical protein